MALLKIVNGPSANERPLGTIRTEKGISSRFRGSMTLIVENDIKPQTFHPSQKSVLYQKHILIIVATFNHYFS